MISALFIILAIAGALLYHGIGVRGESTAAAFGPTPTPRYDGPVSSNANSCPFERITGIAVCDRYISKYEACLQRIAANSPQVMPALNEALETQRNAFKIAASKPESRMKLAKTCKQAIQSAKTASAKWCTDW